MANTAIEPSFDDLLRLVEDVMKVGTRKYDFSSQVPWFVHTDLVRQRCRSHLPDDIPRDESWIILDLAAAEVVGAAANKVSPENDEGLKAMGEHPETQYRNLKRRSQRAAAAQGNMSSTSDRYWRERCMKPFVRLAAKELYRMIHHPNRED